ncbi:hypothetical protein F511_06187 [Dorcoceras hygrometricum]|uniref:Uncharacterized protein n=1 Tax=Dorcoceras hygrometricum TaxID=472368 RepID=A0A2Z7CKY0_9LAMI|nr:hypothetical protein F511_06187 [Dorcoceras hygrometricum]
MLHFSSHTKTTPHQLIETMSQRSTSLYQILSKQPTTGCAQQSKRRRKEYVSIAANSKRNQQLVTNSSQLVPDAIPETLRFNLSKRRWVAPTTGSSNQQLVIQLGQFLTTQQLITLQSSTQHQKVDQHVSLSR